MHCRVSNARANVVPTKLPQLNKGGLQEFRYIFATLEKDNTMTGLMVSMLAFVAGVKDKLESEKGATATEYGLLVGLIALIIVVGVGLFGKALDGFFTDLATTVGKW
jgi:pilus assembly protein Flp/PilA